nr:MAG TPA: hypothetical protein [Caudoviricetes sp.]
MRGGESHRRSLLLYRDLLFPLTFSSVVVCFL